MAEHVYQPMLFSGPITASFPSTRYQGSKTKLVDWIWEQLAGLDFDTCLDAFGGTGVMAYRFKQAGKAVAYNDLLRFNYIFGQALIENRGTLLSHDDVEWALLSHADMDYPSFVQDTFAGIYFTDEENTWIDRVITNIRLLRDPYKSALAFFALAQACIIKRPYNLFHRKNLYVRLADVERSFGNKTTWDTPFDTWFCQFVEEANRAVFDNGRENHVFNGDACDVPGDYDLVYVDPPYISNRGIGVNYRDFYHFLEGLTLYDKWETLVDYHSKHRRLKPQPNSWTDKRTIHKAFDRLFARYRDSILVISYRSDGIPSISELSDLLRGYKAKVEIRSFGEYKYVLSTNGESKEVLLIAE